MPKVGWGNRHSIANSEEVGRVIENRGVGVHARRTIRPRCRLCDAIGVISRNDEAILCRWLNYRHVANF